MCICERSKDELKCSNKCFCLKIGRPWPFLLFVFLIIKTIFHQTNVKMIRLVSGALIRTHNLLGMNIST